MSRPQPPPLPPAPPPPSLPPLPGVGAVTAGMPLSEHWTLHVRAAYRAFLMSRVPAPGFSMLHLIVGLISMMSVIAFPFGLWHLYRAFKPRRVIPHAVKDELEFAERAVLVFAEPLMVNSLIREPGDHQVPGLCLVTFDPEAAASRKLAGEIGLRVLLPQSEQLPPEDVAVLEDLMEDEEYQRARRRRLPDSATDGYLYYAVDLALLSWYLPDRRLTFDLPGIPCLAEPGEQGRIRHVPYWLVFGGTPPPPWAATCPVLLA